MKRIFKYLIAASMGWAVAIGLTSCQGDDPDNDKPFLDGSLLFTMPGYVKVGDVLELTPESTKKREDGSSDIGYYWSCTYDNKCDTTCREHQVVDPKWTYTVPDSVGVFTIKVVAYAEGYETSSVSQEFTVVKEGLNGKSSITNFDLHEDDTKFTDPRDGKEYLCTKIGGTTWMRQNLAWEEKGKAYIGQKALTNIFGHFYTWEEAQDICPAGWSLPTEEDWVELGKACGAADAKKYETFNNAAGSMMVNAKFNGGLLWEFWPAVPITDKTRFAAFPMGYATIEDGKYIYWYFTINACFWTADEYNGEGLYRYLIVDENNIYINSADKKLFAANVRCVKH